VLAVAEPPAVEPGDAEPDVVKSADSSDVGGAAAAIAAGSALMGRPCGEGVGTAAYLVVEAPEAVATPARDGTAVPPPVAPTAFAPEDPVPEEPAPEDSGSDASGPEDGGSPPSGAETLLAGTDGFTGCGPPGAMEAGAPGW
jgi:hypothetical protein